MKIFCVLFGIIIFIIVYYYDKDVSIAETIGATLFLALGAVIVAGIISLMYPAFCPTTDVDYSFKIYSISNTEQFVIEENDGYYTYVRHFADGNKTESIPTDVTYIIYDDTVAPSVRAEGRKLFDNSKIRGKHIFFFDDQDPSTTQISKYTMVLPTNVIVR